MATRRSRIKGIANLPQRRKVEQKPVETPSTPPKPDTEENNPNSVNANSGSPSSFQAEAAIPTPVDVPSQEVASTNTATDINETDLKQTPEQIELIKIGSVARRRTFIKPTVNAKLLSQRQKPKINSCKSEEPKQESVPDSVTEFNSIVVPQTTSQINTVTAPQLTELQPLKNLTLPSNTVKCLLPNSETECPSEPLSPTKLVNRSRIKAVPRLGQRRTSVTIHGSASESEDDTKRNFKRIRTESACSTVSTGNDIQTRPDPGSPQKNKEFSTIIQRKCKRTEQSRKMAEARRHFQHKFGNKTPDKQKLTMLDLIFYNPNTNPMSQKPKKPRLKSDREESIPKSPEKTEDPDDIHSDEENAMPAPQIKIGANGEIVIDEQSLVIENAETKKGREELKNSELIDGDFDTGYGIYKREKRSKDWSKEETLRFYKALNTLGTDFTLMVQLFEGRSRRELKMKFKKEERVNRALIDKALTRPVEFNIKELSEEVEMIKKRAEEEKINKARQAAEWAEKKKDHILPYSYSGIQNKIKRTYKPKSAKRRGIKLPVRDKSHNDMYGKIEKGIVAVWADDSEESESDTESVKEEKSLTNILKPTRCGRIPKPTKTFNYTSTSTSLQHDEPDALNNMNDLNGLQPGSLMIVYSQTPTGEPTFKVFMVTPGQAKVPLNLTPDMLSNLTQSVSQPTEEILPPENNYTIAHGECNVTTPSENAFKAANEDSAISQGAIDEQLCPYQQHTVNVSTENSSSLPEENVTLCKDGKCDVKLQEEPIQNVT